MEEIGLEQISNNVNVNSWNEILVDVNLERAKAIVQYDVESENSVFDLARLAEVQIDRDDLLDIVSSSEIPSIYNDNYDPFRIIVTDSGERDLNLRRQMYQFDNVVAVSLEKIEIPCLSVYGYYDVVTPMQQGLYFTNNIGTEEEDKSMIILVNSGHSSSLNEPIALANLMIEWIEKYR